MAHFYATIQGNRGQASRMGTAKSGMTAHIRGWDTGVRVYLWVGRDGKDKVSVQRTSGSYTGIDRPDVVVASWVEGAT